MEYIGRGDIGNIEEKDLVDLFLQQGFILKELFEGDYFILSNKGNTLRVVRYLDGFIFTYLMDVNTNNEAIEKAYHLEQLFKMKNLKYILELSYENNEILNINKWR